MKKLLESKFVLVITVVLLTLTIDVIADTMLTSESISYSNNKTEETTVKGSLDELFNTVDINERLGSTDISIIGDGTITGAIDTINSNLTPKTYQMQIMFSDLTWNKSGNGMYFSKAYLNFPVKTILGAYIVNWAGWRNTDIVNIYIPDSSTIGITSNVDTFEPYSYFIVQIVYI